MRHILARRNYLLLREDGSVHYQYSKFLTDRFSNPHTRELVAQSLRIFYRFCVAHGIELALRAVDGRCLTYGEAKSLVELCFRPLREIELMGDKKVVFLTSPKTSKSPDQLSGSVEPNTARKRLDHIALYLDFVREVFLDPNIRSSETRNQLRYEYNKVGHQLRSAIRGTRQNHHLSIRSLPMEKYLAILETVFVNPDELFLTNRGKLSSTFLRDRAMVLLACEGLRPGTLGNIRIEDFRPNSGNLVIKDNRSKRTERISANTPKLKMGDSALINNASETIISLWPFTIQAIHDYLQIERAGVLMKRMANPSDGFLFLNSQGEPIKHRSTITLMFNKLGKRLAELGLLDVGDDPYFPNSKKYDFYGYVLRHSAASFFLAQKVKEISENSGSRHPAQYMDVPDQVKDLMKIRFGWTLNSKMPELYAARALSDQANIVLMDFNQRMLDAAKVLKQEREVESVVQGHR